MDKKIDELVDTLGCSIAEAKDIIEQDKIIDKGGRTYFDLSKEEEKQAKKWGNVTTKKPTVYKFEKKKTAKAVTALNLMKKQDLDTLLIKALDLLDAKAVNGGYYCKSQNKGFLFKFGFEKVTKADVVRAFNLGGEKAEIYAESFDKEVMEFAGRFNGKIELFDGVKTVNLLSNKGVLPSENYSSFYTEKKKPVFKKELLYKKNAKKFFL